MPPHPLLSRRQWLLAAAACGLACNRGPGEAIGALDRGVMALTASENQLLWVTGPDNGKLYIAPLSGKDPRPLLEGLLWPRDLLIQQEQLWVACRDKLLQLPLVGGRSRQLPAKEALRLAAMRDGEGDGVCWLQADGSLHRLREGKPHLVATRAAWPSALASVGEVAYWASGNPAKLHRSDAQGNTETLAEHAAIYDIVAGDSGVFYSSDHAIHQLSAKGESRVLQSDLIAPSALLLHEHTLYFINGSAYLHQGARGQKSSVDTSQKHHALMALHLQPDATKTLSSIAQVHSPQCITLAKNHIYCASAGTRKLWRFTTLS